MMTQRHCQTKFTDAVRLGPPWKSEMKNMSQLFRQVSLKYHHNGDNNWAFRNSTGLDSFAYQGQWELPPH